ncbi:hypothetical protein WR25_23659 isoform B [Diploscapter pachys]|uniref:Homeobox domain-containing protein n=1 Tax=Diploscapter pachys TaxID=2018661 RepID=A0A2A2K4B2_9BILA|nr:hypothetical protein WR25_23659 isoform A [Diploscapter pachys]PAV68756.1 hypothetical protein WR25_23659 isoform B [Diploscapter pachys]
MVYKLGTDLIYHVTCHCCGHCGRGLAPGEQIVVDEHAKVVFCMSHYYQDSAPPESYPQPISVPICDSCPSLPSTSVQPSIPLTFTPEQFSEFHIKKEIDSLGYGFDGYSFSDFCEEDGKFLKRRGPRTTIKQNQLDVLNRIFTTTPKPSKHARAKLALETGLSMRVIQVWFQNRRSKERRLKHLCNYLRHFEQRGLVPPPLFANHSGGEGQPEMTFSQFISGMDASQFDEDSADDQ